MSDILDLRKRVEAAEQKFGVAAETQNKYSARLIALVSSVENAAATAREQHEETRLALLSAKSENEQLRSMLLTLLLAMEKEGDDVGPILKDLEKTIVSLCDESPGESGEHPAAAQEADLTPDASVEDASVEEEPVIDAVADEPEETEVEPEMAAEPDAIEEAALDEQSAVEPAAEADMALGEDDVTELLADSDEPMLEEAEELEAEPADADTEDPLDLDIAEEAEEAEDSAEDSVELIADEELAETSVDIGFEDSIDDEAEASVELMTDMEDDTVEFFDEAGESQAETAVDDLVMDDATVKEVPAEGGEDQTLVLDEAETANGGSADEAEALETDLSEDEILDIDLGEETELDGDMIEIDVPDGDTDPVAEQGFDDVDEVSMQSMTEQLRQKNETMAASD